MGTDKRERQKEARLLRIEAEQRAAKRARTKRNAIRGAIAVVVVLGGLFLWTMIFGDDSGDDGDTETASADETTTTLPSTTTTTFSNPELATEVLGRQPPDPAPPPAETPADALEVTTVTEGQGEAAATTGDTIVVHYVGKLADGTVFDSSWELGQPLTVPAPLGQGGVIPGWDEGLMGVKIGERRRLVIGSDKAYGAEGQGEIPPNAPLAFEIDIVDIVKPG